MRRRSVARPRFGDFPSQGVARKASSWPGPARDGSSALVFGIPDPPKRVTAKRNIPWAVYALFTLALCIIKHGGYRELKR